MQNSESFSERFRALRGQQGLSKSGLARAVGVSATCVWNWEEGNTYPRPNALVRLAAILATTTAYLERGVDLPLPETSGAPKVVRGARDPVGDVIHRAREQIAEAAGIAVEQVKVVLEYGA